MTAQQEEQEDGLVAAINKLVKFGFYW